MKISGTLRALPGGAPVPGMTVHVYRHVDDSELSGSPVVTDAGGRWSLTYNGNPGPYYWVVANTIPVEDVTRRGSSKSYGSGGTYALYELPLALRPRGNGYVPGYLNGLAVTYDGAGLDLDVATGAVLANGIPAVWHSAVEHAVTTARDATNPKQCYLGVDVTGLGQTEEGKAVLRDICGAAAASPSLPSLTSYQTETSYFVPLATFRLPNTGSTTLSQLVDARVNPDERKPILSSIVRRTDPLDEDSTSSTSGADAVGLTTSVTLLAGVTYDLVGRVWLVSRINAAPNTAQIAVYLNTTANLSPYIAHAQTSETGTSNVFALDGVVGTGAAVPCGVRLKVSAGTMTYTVGYFQVIARPRT